MNVVWITLTPSEGLIVASCLILVGWVNHKWVGILEAVSDIEILLRFKSMNMKDAKGAQSAGGQGGPQTKWDSADISTLDVVDMVETNVLLSDNEIVDGEVAKNNALNEEQDDFPEDEVVLEARQAAINLIGIDAQRGADFCRSNQEIPENILEVAIAAGFLVHLTGWLAVLAGLAVPVIFQLLNSTAAKKYTAQQSAAMAARNIRSHVVTEVLNGICQIMFSAIEGE